MGSRNSFINLCILYNKFSQKNFLSKVFMKLMEYNIVKWTERKRLTIHFNSRTALTLFLIIWSLKICSFKYQTKNMVDGVELIGSYFEKRKKKKGPMNLALKNFSQNCSWIFLVIAAVIAEATVPTLNRQSHLYTLKFICRIFIYVNVYITTALFWGQFIWQICF